MRINILTETMQEQMEQAKENLHIIATSDKRQKVNDYLASVLR